MFLGHILFQMFCGYSLWYCEALPHDKHFVQSVQLKSGPYFNISNLFTKIYNMLCYTPNLYLQ